MGVTISMLLPIIFTSLPWYTSFPILLLTIGSLMGFIGVNQNQKESSESLIGINDALFSFLWGSIIFTLGLVFLISIFFPGLDILVYFLLFLALTGVAFGILWLFNNRGFSYD
ncbi:hypothetical protein DSECCO2_05190 [anaerobic digester metagenome]